MGRSNSEAPASADVDAMREGQFLAEPAASCPVPMGRLVALKMLKGGQGVDPTYSCVSPGMPRIMIAYAPMEVVVTPEVSYILMERDQLLGPGIAQRPYQHAVHHAGHPAGQDAFRRGRGDRRCTPR